MRVRLLLTHTFHLLPSRGRVPNCTQPWPAPRYPSWRHVARGARADKLAWAKVWQWVGTLTARTDRRAVLIVREFVLQWCGAAADTAVTIFCSEDSGAVEGLNMRDCNVHGTSIPDGAVYKEVVIIGTFPFQKCWLSAGKLPRVWRQCELYVQVR
jgi:hypothetical protein